MDLFFVGKLKKKLMKPSEIKPEEQKEYYCVGEVPENGIAIFGFKKDEIETKYKSPSSGAVSEQE